MPRPPRPSPASACGTRLATESDGRLRARRPPGTASSTARATRRTSAPGMPRVVITLGGEVVDDRSVAHTAIPWRPLPPPWAPSSAACGPSTKTCALLRARTRPSAATVRGETVPSRARLSRRDRRPPSAWGHPRGRPSCVLAARRPQVGCCPVGSRSGQQWVRRQRVRRQRVRRVRVRRQRVRRRNRPRRGSGTIIADRLDRLACSWLPCGGPACRRLCRAAHRLRAALSAPASAADAPAPGGLRELGRSGRAGRRRPPGPEDRGCGGRGARSTGESRRAGGGQARRPLLVFLRAVWAEAGARSRRQPAGLRTWRRSAAARRSAPPALPRAPRPAGPPPG